MEAREDSTVKISSAEAEQHNISYIPIELFGKWNQARAKGPRITIPVQDQRVENCFSIWCCFFNPLDKRLWAGYASVANYRSINTLDWQRLYLIDLSYYARRRSLHEARTVLVEEKRESGMDLIPGKWHIKPGWGKIVNTNNVISIPRDEIDAGDLPPNGLEPDPVTQSEPMPGENRDITRRLAQANPSVDSWFF